MIMRMRERNVWHGICVMYDHVSMAESYAMAVWVLPAFRKEVVHNIDLFGARDATLGVCSHMPWVGRSFPNSNHGEEHENTANHDAVSYTHLTLPTTPYV